VISPSQGLYLHTEQQEHRIDAHNTDIHVLSGIRTHDPSVRASEDSSSRGLSDQHVQVIYIVNEEAVAYGRVEMKGEKVILVYSEVLVRMYVDGKVIENYLKGR
jgi:hypothetical protein